MQYRLSDTGLEMQAEKTIYLSLAEELRLAIKKGTLKPEEKLPSVRRFAQHKRISVSTAVSVYRELEKEGLVRSRARSGFIVAGAQQPSIENCAALLRPGYVDFSGTMLNLLSEQAGAQAIQLGLAQVEDEVAPADAIARITRSLFRDGEIRHGYAHPLGIPELREEIKKLSLSRGLITDRDDIVVTHGCHEALWLALRACAKPGDVIACEVPTYPGFFHICASLNLQVLEIPSRDGEGLNLDSLKIILKSRKIAAVYFTPNASNPAGVTLSRENKAGLYALLEEHNVTGIEDDTNHDLVFAGAGASTVSSLSGNADIMYCGSFSKSLAPGLRVGWIIPGKWRDKITELKYEINLGTNALTQQIVTGFLKSGEYQRHVRQAVSIHELAAERMKQSIACYWPADAACSNPSGGFLLWVKLPKDVLAAKFCDLSREQGIQLADGRMFGNKISY
ncbi:MAG: PLP-dependent aminotransferase family protein, partial [Gammaproteobacteria bacterium]|nr:PLP-dependent aminotransferase family protein [Gammaproteobacteria bacterium]